jgi:predicted nucleic acid-binding protein
VPVVDASVLVEYLAGAEHASVARQAVIGEVDNLWAPHLVDAEVGRALRRSVVHRLLTPEDAAEALRDLGELPIQRAPHVTLLPRALELRDNLSFYDALYVALAERLEMPLLTFDGRLRRAAPTGVKVRAIGPGG